MNEKYLNVFGLHDSAEDLKPTSWVCVGGKNVRKIISLVLDEILMSEKPEVYVKFEPVFRKKLIGRCSELCGSQKKLANKLGVSQQAISKWNLGIRYIPLNVAKIMSKMLRVPNKETEKKMEHKKFEYKRTISKYELSKILAEELNCSYYVVWRSLSDKIFIPIPVISALLKIWRKKTKKSYSETKTIFNEINRSSDIVKLNNPISKPLKAVKRLDENLCKILGAFAADGNLYLQVKVSSTYKSKIEEILVDLDTKNYNDIKIYFDKGRHCYYFQTSNNKIINEIRKNNLTKSAWISFIYKITLREQYKKSVDIFAEWFKDVFGIKLNVRKSKGENEWYVVTSNKIIGRYLKTFGFPAGKKAEIVDEPPIIKESKHCFRKDFALGVITFDGSVSMDSRLKLMVKSEKLRNSVAGILIEDFGKDSLIIGTTKRKEYYLTTKKNIPIKKLMGFVEKDTIKYNKLATILNMHKISLNEIEPIMNALEGKNVKLKLMDVFNFLREEKETNIYSLQTWIKKEMKKEVSLATLHRMLGLLGKTKFVNVQRKRDAHKIMGYKNIYKFNEVL